MRPIICGIYKITSPSGKVYIGQSRNILIRWRDHKRDKKPKSKLFYSFKKYGLDNHTFEIIHNLPYDVEQEIINKYEQIYMDLYKSCSITLLNLRDAGSRGKLSDETKRKLSESKKGKIPWNKGTIGASIAWNKGLKYKRPLSEESRRKRSEYMKGKRIALGTVRPLSAIISTAEKNRGRKISDEQREIIRKCAIGNNRGIGNRGKVRTDENKKKISESLKNRVDNKGSKNNLAVLNENQVLEIRKKHIPKIYGCVQLSREFNVSKGTILGIINRQTWKHI